MTRIVFVLTCIFVLTYNLSISRLVSSGAANKIEIAAADNYLSSRDNKRLPKVISVNSPN
jgi:hypothetical protein